MALIIWAVSFWQFKFLSSGLISEYLQIRCWKKKKKNNLDTPQRLLFRDGRPGTLSNLHYYWPYLGAWKQNPQVAIFPSIKGYKTSYGSLCNQILSDSALASLSKSILHCCSLTPCYPGKGRPSFRSKNIQALSTSGSEVGNVHTPRATN